MSPELPHTIVLAMQFQVEMDHARYWEERIPSTANTPIPRIGSPEHYFMMVNDFTRRSMPHSTSAETRDNYVHELITDEDDKTTLESRLFLLPTAELLWQAHDLKYENSRMSVTDIALSRMLSKNSALSEEAVIVTTAFVSDELAFWRYVVTRGLDFYKDEIMSAPDLPQRVRLRQMKAFIEQLLREEVTPFTPEEFQTFVETYIIDRIQRDPDRLNPLLFDSET